MHDTQVFPFYEERRLRCEKARSVVNSIISEKEELFARTQPKGVAYDKDRVSGGAGSNPMEAYVISLEKAKIPERLEEAKAILRDREELLSNTERLLRVSMDIFDRVYVLRHLEKRRIYVIASRLHYSESQIYRIIKRIDERCEKMRENV